MLSRNAQNSVVQTLVNAAGKKAIIMTT